MTAFLDLLSGKKTYLIALLTGILGLLQAFGVLVEIPEWVWAVLGALGLGAVRAGISTSAK